MVKNKNTSFLGVLKKYIVLHIILFIYSFGGIFSKLAAGESFLSLRYMIFYGILLLNLFIYAIIWQQVIKHINLTTAYANKGVTIIWGMFFGRLFFEETVTISKIVGAVIILSGVVLVVTADEK